MDFFYITLAAISAAILFFRFVIKKDRKDLNEHKEMQQNHDKEIRLSSVRYQQVQDRAVRPQHDYAAANRARRDAEDEERRRRTNRQDDDDFIPIALASNFFSSPDPVVTNKLRRSSVGRAAGR